MPLKFFASSREDIHGLPFVGQADFS